MKLCTRCGRSWPVEGNFCPIDGSELVNMPEESAAPAEPAASEEREDATGEGGWGDGPEDERPASGAAGTPREFSETQWFMVGADPDSLQDAHDAGDLGHLQEKYDRDSSIPSEVRRKFTLKRPGGAGDGGKAKKGRKE